MNPVVRSDWAGQIVDDRLPLQMWLGGSSHSGVFLTAMPDDPGRKAVIKLIPTEVIDLEVSTLSRPPQEVIAHPHLMPLLRTGQCMFKGIAFTYVVTDSADEVLSSVLLARPLTTEEAREMLEPVLDALSYLHGKGLVHTRLKPSNVLVAEDRLQLSMDGVCYAGLLGRTDTKHTIYDAPETGSLPFSAATDMWSLGIMLVEALTQHAPDWNRATQSAPIVPPGIPEPFASIARACLRPQPSLRCTLSDVRAMLTGELGSSADQSRMSSARASHRPAAKLWQGTERTKTPWRSLRMPLLVLAVVVALLFAALKLHSPRPTSPESTTPATQPADDASGAREHAPRAKPRPEHHLPSAEPASNESAEPMTSVSSEPSAQNGIVRRVVPQVLPAAQASIRGTVNVVARVQVDSTGRVASATLESPGPSRYFAKISLEAAQQWQFAPDSQASSASRAWLLHFAYRQSGVEITPAATLR